jgi:hypothetical protein
MADIVNESDNPTYECKRGWLINMNDDGSYLPFFVKVREEDLVWKNDLNSDIFKTIISDMKTYGFEFTSDLQTPSPELHITCGNWHYYVKGDYSFRARYVSTPDKSDYIAEYTTFDNVKKLTGAYMNITIPFPVSDDVMLIGNMSPSGSSIISYTPFKKRSYHPKKSFDNVRVSIEASAQPGVIVEYNTEMISNLLDGTETARLSLYMEGTLYH